MRCPVCFESIAGASRPCADCGTPYHAGCFAEGGCVVAGCKPRERLAIGELAHSPLWRPAIVASSLGIAIGVLSAHPDSGLPVLLSRMGVSLAISCWCAGGGGLLIAGFQDLGWNIPVGNPMRPDRLGTMAAMSLGLAMALVGAGSAMRVVDATNSQLSLIFCAGAAGLTLVGVAMSMMGLVFDTRRTRALQAVVPLLIAMGAIALEVHVAQRGGGPRTSGYPQLPKPPR